MRLTANPTYTAPGDILSTNAEGVRGDLLATLASVPDGGLLDVDLRASRLVDSVGLNLLVSAIKQGRGRNIRLRLIVAHPNLLRILTFTRLGQHADIIDEVKRT